MTIPPPPSGYAYVILPDGIYVVSQLKAKIETKP